MPTLAKISREVLENYLYCRTKGFRTLIGEHGTKTEYETWSRAVATQQRLNATADFLARYRGGTVRKDITFATFDATDAPDALLNVNLDTETVSLSFDSLVRDGKSASRGKTAYTPVLFGNSPGTTQRNVLLGVVARIISQLQGKECSDAIIFQEGRRPRTVRLTDSIKNQARTALSDLEALLRGGVPSLVLNEHCQVCEFRSRCHEQAVRDDNLSLLRGMDSTAIARLNSKGIFTVNQLSYTFKARRRPKRAKKLSRGHSPPLRALALREKKIFVHGNPEVKIADIRVYLDIEGTPLEHTYYLIGVHVVSGGIESNATFWADTASSADQIQIFEGFLLHLNKYTDYAILHFGNYERVALRRMQTRMGGRYSNQIEDVLRRMINILSLIAEHVYFPTYSNSLKDIGSFLGHQWSDASSSGVQTLVWRSMWLDQHNPLLKEKLIKYNEEDCLALRTVVEFLEQVDRSSPASPLRDRIGTEVVRTAALSAKKDGWPLFGKTNYVLEDFHTINKLSYFDYQRDKVFARTEKHRSKAPDRAKQKSLKPNKTVIHRAARCPRCRSREIKSQSYRAHDVVDLKFTQGGVKRWITRYITWCYRCTRCGNTLLPAANRDQQQLPRYGRGLIGWCMYQLLIGGQNLNRIHRSLPELFGLTLPKVDVYLFKRAVAAYFEAGYERILGDLLSGGLIHVDETTINLQKEKGYVWVLASTNSVYFFYKKSREGSFLASMLRRFKGVLVSDFFTAYDALDVPQQRCLVHLMRDINEDLLKHPFDDELKSCAVRFSALLKEIVLTIDKYGLKRRHLNKHIRPAARFCRWMTEENFTSEIVRGYARRIGKYNDYLFQFLEHDGVPWNNSSAERAIKSFAKFRRSSNGVATEQTIRDYLVILSICLTCEYRGIDFLKVLLGSTKDDFSFGPKRHTPIRLRPPHNAEIPRIARGRPAQDTPPMGSSDTALPCERIISLNRVLPRILRASKVRFLDFGIAPYWRPIFGR